MKLEAKEFIETTSRLEQAFDKEYTSQQQKIMFEELKNMSIERYKKATQKLIRENKYLPKISDILEKSKEVVLEKKNEERVVCKRCDSTGFIVYKKKVFGREYDFVARCECANGLNISNQIPLASEIGL